MKIMALFIITIVLVVVEVTVAQWLLGCFGFYFGFWQTLGILLAADFLFGALFGGKK